MAYCNKCGAYIPDGQSKCLACGYDETEEAASAAKAEAAAKATQAAAHSAAAAQQNDTTYHFRNDDELYRIQLEENRRRQQEQNRKWAEQEQQRRQAQREYQERMNQKRGTVGDNMRDSVERGFEEVSAKMEAGGWSSARLWSVLSYVSVLCLIPLLTGKGGPQANFHAKQGIRLLIFSAVADALSRIPLIGWIFSLARVALMVIGIINALQDKTEPLPYIGNIGSF